MREVTPNNRIGVCLCGIHHNVPAQFIGSLCAHAADEGLLVQIFAPFTELSGKDHHDLGEASVFDYIEFEKLMALVILSETFKDDGIVKNLVQKANNAGIPVISVDKPLENCFNITYDYSNSFEEIVRHVIEEHGCYFINFLAGMKDNPFSDERIEVYKKILAEHNIPFEEERLGYGDFWELPAKAAVENFLQGDLPLPEAIICCNDEMAVAACDVLQAHGFKVPDDVIVTGFDGYELGKLYSPTITTCEQDTETAARVTVTLCKDISNGMYTAPIDYSIDFKTVYNGSCGCKECESAITNQSVVWLFHKFKTSRAFHEHSSMMALSLSDGLGLTEVCEYMDNFFQRVSCHCAAVVLRSSYVNPLLPSHKEPFPEDSMVQVIDFRKYEYDTPFVVSEATSSFPFLEECAEDSNQLLYIPLHMHDRVFGYLMIGCNHHFSLLDYDLLRVFTDNLNRIFASL